MLSSVRSTRRARRVPPEESGVLGPRAPGIDGPRHARGGCRLRGALNGKSDSFTAALHTAPLGLLGVAAALQLLALLSRTEAWNVSRARHRGDGRPPLPVPRGERRVGGVGRQRPALRRGPHRRPAALEPGREPARSGAARGRGPDPRHGGHPRRTDVLHPRRARSGLPWWVPLAVRRGHGRCSGRACARWPATGVAGCAPASPSCAASTVARASWPSCWSPSSPRSRATT